jgi:TRAP-type C4-dicarboxylate transport system permease large subunit
MLDTAGVIDVLALSVAGIGTPLFAALLMLFIAGVISAFASTNAMFVVLVPLAAPLLVSGDIPAMGFAIALCIAASVVDSNPCSTAGALVLANTDEHRRDRTFKGLATWAFWMIGIVPLLTWMFFVVLAG